MKRLADEGMTMIVVTHEMTFARRVADWVVVFEQGTVIEQGPPGQIFERRWWRARASSSAIWVGQGERVTHIYGGSHVIDDGIATRIVP